MKILIIGAGLAGCTIARLLCDKNQVEIIEKNGFIGGNCYDYVNRDNVLIHRFGPHIFHTDNPNVWKFVNKFDEFRPYINRVLVEIDGKQVEFPINLNSIKELFPNSFKDFLFEINKHSLLDKQVSIQELMNKITEPKNKEIVKYIFDNVFANYSAKMWGTSIDKIDPKTIERVKINLNYEWNYFAHDKYCGLPIHGYTYWIAKMIDHENIKLYLNRAIKKYEIKNNLLYVDDNYYDYVIYTGSIDELFNNELGTLPYRSLNIEFETIYNDYYQNVGVINYPQHPEMTRICEYKHLTGQYVKGVTTISKEFPGDYNPNNPKYNIRFYPIKNDENISLYNEYFQSTKKINNLFLLGRLAQYRYFDMDEIIEEAMNLAESIKN